MPSRQAWRPLVHYICVAIRRVPEVSCQVSDVGGVEFVAVSEDGAHARQLLALFGPGGGHLGDLAFNVLVQELVECGQWLLGWPQQKRLDARSLLKPTMNGRGLLCGTPQCKASATFHVRR